MAVRHRANLTTRQLAPLSGAPTATVCRASSASARWGAGFVPVPVPVPVPTSPGVGGLSAGSSGDFGAGCAAGRGTFRRARERR
ncbi:hypothetical protein Kpho02_46130 [Kitasatospora phosalacinea]|uniref:Uncharacterized protein n=1 Tax=Kitasatospora phosalacinea TaxID=2065 RepID=A0A9W6Q9T2_9ACTN|nr:hypothetical protein Kpho02_46130 [Kitasatospora phosalacinea]